MEIDLHGYSLEEANKRINLHFMNATKKKIESIECHYGQRVKIKKY